MIETERVAAMLALGVALGCAGSREPAVGGPPVTAPPLEATATATATSSSEATATTSSPAAEERAGSGGPGSPRTPGLSPPRTPGETRNELLGCVARAAGDAGDGDRFPVQAPSRAGGVPEVTVSTTGMGIVVTHDVGHACCLRATIDASVVDGTVNVHEALSGTPCRCTCRSTLKTAVGLAPGRYALRVDLDSSGTTRRVHSGDVTIERLRR